MRCCVQISARVHHVSFGKAQSLHSEATSEDLPVYTTNLCFLRVRGGDQRAWSENVDKGLSLVVNQVYYVCSQQQHLAML